MKMKEDQKIQKGLQQEIEVPEHFTKAIQETFSKKKERRNPWLITRNVAAILLVFCATTILAGKTYATIKWNIEFQEFENRPQVYSLGSIKDAVERGYHENVDMDYAYQDSIGVKIDSLIITDNDFSMNVNFQFLEDGMVGENFTYSYAIVDENKNVYAISTKMRGST